MDPLLLGLSGMGGLLLGVGGAAAVLGPWLATGHRAEVALRRQLADEQHAQRTLQQRAHELERLVDERDRSVREARGLAREHELEVSRLTEVVAGLEGELERAGVEALTAADGAAALQERLASVERARDAARKELMAAQAAVTRLSTGLTLLGLQLPDRSWSPTDRDRRERSRQALRELLVDTASSAVALVDRSGLPCFGVGADVHIERLSLTAALLGELEPALGVVLCAPPRELTIATSLGASHVVAVPGTPWLLAIENHGAVPAHAVRNALLALAGRPQPPRPVPATTSVVPESTRAPDPALERVLAHWGRRWSAEQVSVLDAAGHPLATTDVDGAGALLGLRRALGPVLARFRRDHWPMADVVIRVAAPDLSLTLQPVDDDRETTLVAVVARTPPEARAVDELVSLVRWHVNPRPHLAAS